MTNRFARLGLRAVVLCALAGAAQGQNTTRISVTSTGAQGNSQSFDPSISFDGRYVAFHSFASNLVLGDTNAASDVFVHDRQTATTWETTRVSVDSAGAQANNNSRFPSISADGRFVAFVSLATDLVLGDTNTFDDVFVHNRLTRTTTRVSVASDGTQGNHISTRPSISADGRFVAFESTASNLVASDTNGSPDAFVHDMQTGVTTRVSVDSTGAEGNNHTAAPSIAADGQFVAFESSSSNLVPGDTNGFSDVFVHDRQTGAITRVSVHSLGTQTNNFSDVPSISADGRFVAFRSLASNLVSGDTNDAFDVFVHDRHTGATTCVSVSSLGAQGNNISSNPAISPDGRFVAFYSEATNLLPPGEDTNGHRDVFVHDRQTGSTTRISVDSAGAEGNGASGEPADSVITADGGYVTFSSLATNLVPGDTNAVADIFVRYLLPLLPPETFAADDQPSALSIANFDEDNLPDIAVVNAGSASVTLLRNIGAAGDPPSFAGPSPAFTTPIGAQPRAIASADIDGDDEPDLAIVSGDTGVSGAVSILLSRGDGTFAIAPTVEARDAPRGVALADLDRDGQPDLIVARRDADAVSIFRNLGGGNFGLDQPQNVPPGGRPSGVGSGDLDNDKDIDVVVPTSEGNMIVVFPNASPGMGAIAFGPRLTFPVGAGSARPAAVVVAHLDGDQFLDVAVANKNTNTVGVLRNKGVDGGGVWLGFEAPVEFTVGSLPVSIGAADIYGAGSIDLFTANAFVDATDQSSFSLLRNASSGPGSIAFELEREIDLPPFAAHVAWGDVNLDGRTDVAVATGFDVTTITDSPAVKHGRPRGGSPARGSPFGFAAVLENVSASVALAPCDGDANGDRVVDFLDLNIVLSFYGQSGPALPGDLDADEDVDFVDLNIVLSAFGTAC